MKDEGRVFPKAEHPVIRTHPVSGKRALYVNRGFTTRIVQLKKADGAAEGRLGWLRSRRCVLTRVPSKW